MADAVQLPACACRWYNDATPFHDLIFRTDKVGNQIRLLMGSDRLGSIVPCGHGHPNGGR